MVVTICLKYFKDADATEEYQENSWMIPKVDSSNENQHTHTDADNDAKCDVCDSVLDNVQDDSQIADTGDNSNIFVWMALVVISLSGIFVCIVHNKKRVKR